MAIEAIGFEDGADILLVGQGGGARRLGGFGSPLGWRKQEPAHQLKEEDCPGREAQPAGVAA